MELNEHQKRLWLHMIALIEDYKKGSIPYRNMVYGLEGDLYAGEFKDERLIRQWNELWGPLEEFSAIYGNNTSFKEVDKFLVEMKSFLENVFTLSNTCT